MDKNKGIINDKFLHLSNLISKGISYANSSIKLTDPVKSNFGRDIGPSFNPDDHIIRVPVLPPKKFPFLLDNAHHSIFINFSIS